MSQDHSSNVGKRVVRLDAPAKVTGSAVYGVDVELPGMLHGATLRSPYPHAKIIAIDTSAALKAPGVRAVVTGRDFAYRFGDVVRDQPFLATDRVRFVGDPVVAVAAETEAGALEALERIQVRYEELPAVFDPREAMAEGAPLIHPDFEKYAGAIPAGNVSGTNICLTRQFSLGDVEKGLAEADEVFEDLFSAPALSHAALEPHAAIAQYTPLDGHYIVWSATDRPHRLHIELADALGLLHTQIRFIVPYEGGSFGGKNSLRAEAIAVALARFTHGRPVKVVFSRAESIGATQTRLAAYMRLTTGVRKDGTFTARRVEVVWDNGAYISNAPGVATRGVLTILGPYRIPNLDLISRLVYTNKETTGSYRGFGTTQVTWACEVQMDMIAAKLGIDPLAIRLKNAYVEGDAYINGQIMRDVRVKETIEKAGREIGLGSDSPSPAPARRRGKGIATMLKGTATPTDSFCLIKADVDGKVTVFSSSSEIGAGEKTVIAQIAADAVGVPLSAVSFPNPDTAITPYDHGVSSSRTTFHMGNCVQQAGRDLRNRLLGFAGEVLQADPGRLTISDGKIIETGVGERMTLKELLAEKFNGKSGAIFAEGHYTPAGNPILAAREGLKNISSIFWMFATHAAEVEVDTETGVVKVLKVAAAHDVGRAINPMGCEQQIEGSVILGLSNTLFEEFKMDRGRILNDGFSDYKLATMEDLPKIVSILIESESGKDALAVAKGIGEPAAAATAPAIANAIYNAVGARIKDLPITPDKVLAALRMKAEKEGR